MSGQHSTPNSAEKTGWTGEWGQGYVCFKAHLGGKRPSHQVVQTLESKGESVGFQKILRFCLGCETSRAMAGEDPPFYHKALPPETAPGTLAFSFFPNKPFILE